MLSSGNCLITDVKDKNVEYKTKTIGGYDMFHIGICDDEKGTCAKLENVNVEVYVWYTGESLCEETI